MAWAAWAVWITELAKAAPLVIVEYVRSTAVMATTDAPDELMVARNMIEVHGRQAATVARGNARAAALAAQIPPAKSWIRVLGIIQRQQTDKSAPS